MIAVVQRVQSANVKVNGETVGEIGRGFMVLVGIRRSDTEAEADRRSKKLAALRICDDDKGVMNLNLPDYCDQNGGRPEMLVVSQFTLCADTSHGNRPSYIDAAPPEAAKPLYEYFVETLRRRGLHIETGIFQADMQVGLVNDGPVTIILDTDRI